MSDTEMPAPIKFLLIYLTGAMLGSLGLMIIMKVTGANDKSKCLESIVAKYPTSRICQIPDKEYGFIVVTPTGVCRYVRTYNFTNPGISSDEEMFAIEPRIEK